MYSMVRRFRINVRQLLIRGCESLGYRDGGPACPSNVPLLVWIPLRSNFVYNGVGGVGDSGAIGGGGDADPRGGARVTVDVVLRRGSCCCWLL